MNPIQNVSAITAAQKEVLQTHAPERLSPLPAGLRSVAVVGLGYVGLPLAILARERGFTTVGIDIDAHKRAVISSGQVADLDVRLLASLRKKPLNISGKFSAIEDSRVVIICVPTPVDGNHEPDLSIVKDAATAIARHLRPGHLIILESTVHPGTTEEVVIPLMEKVSGLTAGLDFDIAHCPERINPGDNEWPVDRIPRVVGGITAHARDEAVRFYRSILKAPIHEMETIREAEAVKMVENSFRDINIAFVNELAMSFNKLNIDVVNVLKGASTKPFGFMLHHPGCGVGGHCIPVDPYYLIRYAANNGFTHAFLSLARTINNSMPSFTVQLLKEELQKKGKALHESKIALLGLSYKADVCDLRESPALEIEAELKNQGAEVRTYDPHILEKSTARTLGQALRGSDAAVVATAHKEFKQELTPELLTQNGVQVLIDGRNCLDKHTFTSPPLIYKGIGR